VSVRGLLAQLWSHVPMLVWLLRPALSCQ
jgi:hypothetical protein